MGSGVIGVTSAYFLARMGHEVTVLDKNSEAANDCSFANGGQLSYSHIEPFSSKTSITLVLKAFFSINSFLKIKDLRDKNFLKWFFEFIKNYNEKTSQKNTKKLFILGKYSKATLSWILKEEGGLKFDYSQKGILHFFRNHKLFAKAKKQAELQKSFGDKIEICDAKRCVELEPTLTKLSDKKKLVGGIFHQEDESGNCFKFTQSLAKICQEKYGVVFEYNSEIKNILTNHKKITGINTLKKVFTADKYIYALGAAGIGLLNGIKIDSKIYPIKGYSLSIATNEEFLAPKIGLTDPENKIVYSRIGNIFRAAGVIEFCKFNEDKNIKLLKFLEQKIKASFSNFGDIAKTQEWQGFRPFRPNSIPLICKVEKYGNLFLNTGHGHLGWTMSCGSAKVLSDIISEKNPKDFEFLKEEKI